MANWKPIHTKVPNYTVFYSTLVAGFDKPMEPSQKDFEGFVKTWEHKPRLKTKVTKSVMKIQAFTGVTSNWTKGKKATADDIFMFVVRGTDVNYAVMTRNFEAKTKVGSLISGSGAGGLRYVNPNKPNPGIKARRTEHLVKSKNVAQIKRDYRLLVALAAKASGLHKIGTISAI